MNKYVIVNKYGDFVTHTQPWNRFEYSKHLLQARMWDNLKSLRHFITNCATELELHEDTVAASRARELLEWKIVRVKMKADLVLPVGKKAWKQAAVHLDPVEIVRLRNEKGFKK